MATTISNRPGTKAHARMVRMSASKARVVLNLIRGKQVNEAMEILSFSERLASEVIGKCLASAVANAEHNDDLNADELFISVCFADQGPTLKRFRPRARGRAGRIHKQTCHITIEVSRYTEAELDQLRVSSDLKSEGRQSRSKGSEGGGGDRARRVAKSRAATQADEATQESPDEMVEEEATDAAVEAAAEATETDAADQVSDATDTDTETGAGDEADADQATDAADTETGAGDEADADGASETEAEESN